MYNATMRSEGNARGLAKGKGYFKPRVRGSQNSKPSGLTASVRTGVVPASDRTEPETRRTPSHRWETLQPSPFPLRGNVWTTTATVVRRVCRECYIQNVQEQRLNIRQAFDDLVPCLARLGPNKRTKKIYTHPHKSSESAAVNGAP